MQRIILTKILERKMFLITVYLQIIVQLLCSFRKCATTLFSLNFVGIKFCDFERKVEKTRIREYKISRFFSIQ